MSALKSNPGQLIRDENWKAALTEFLKALTSLLTRGKELIEEEAARKKKEYTH